MMADYYGRFLKKDVFKSQGFYEGGNYESFFKYFTNGNVQYVGKVHRFVNMQSREIVSKPFKQFLSLQKIPFSASYRMAEPNMDASFRSISKYDKDQPSYDYVALQLACEWTKIHFKPFLGGSKLMGVDDVLVEMDKTTSCGYPWSLQYHNKTQFLGDEIAKGVLDDYWNLIGCDEVKIHPIWTCSQKVEMRSVSKLLENNLRTFTGSPIELSVVTNRLFLDMNNRFYGAIHKSWSCVGMSTYLGEWNLLYKRLSVHPHAFELDESQFDSSISKQLLYCVRDIRISMWDEDVKTPENIRKAFNVYNEIIDSLIVCENGDLIRKSTGNPSGCSNTVVDNTLVLMILFAYAFITIGRKTGYEVSYKNFQQNVSAALYGDDNTFTVSDEIVSWFNPYNIKTCWDEILVFTKTPSFESRKLSEVQFLSQGFVYYKELGWLPCPETNKILSSLLYGSKVDDVRWHLLRACALRMASYGNMECRKILTQFIDYLFQNYKNEFVGEIKGIHSQDIIALWRSDDYIEALYTGYESSVINKHAGTALKIIKLAL